jgi:hypothetical protein
MQGLILAPAAAACARLAPLLSGGTALSWIQKLRLDPLADALQRHVVVLSQSYSLPTTLIGTFLLFPSPIL